MSTIALRAAQAVRSRPAAPAPAGSGIKHPGLKRFLVGLVLLGAVAGFGSGTMATFTAQTQSKGNSFALGTLNLSNTVQGGSTCYSTAPGFTVTAANTGSCQAMFNLSKVKPGDAGSVNLTITNQGTINASAFRVYMTSCVNGNAGPVVGTSNPCGDVLMYIQQWSSAYSTPVACVYGATSSSTTCSTSFPDATKTLANFNSTYPSSASGDAITVGSGPGIAAASSGYFTVGFEVPPATDNTYQGRSATFDVSWFISQ